MSRLNILTFDIEDWHQLVEWKLNRRLPPCSSHVLGQTYDILEALSRRGVRATFFILGLVAEAHPRLVRDIAAAGHEVGSHGWSHQLIHRQTRDAFAAETQRAKAVLEDALGVPVNGYRAAEFSITLASRWALDVLAEQGFTYDSSIFPVAGSRYGIAGTPLEPHTVQTASGAITEVPLTAVERGGRRWPVGGGGYFRLLPYAVTRAAIVQTNQEGRAANLYFHPYEFSRSLLIPNLSPLSRYVTSGRYVLLHNVNRGLNRRRFARLLQDFQFAPIREVLRGGR
jgi:polysaccharide deacetylase family protein (PEP-CTERM system associated)